MGKLCLAERVLNQVVILKVNYIYQFILGGLSNSCLIFSYVVILIEYLFAGSEEHRRNGLLSAFHRHKSSKVLNEGSDNLPSKKAYDEVNCKKMEQTLAKIFFECTDTVEKQKCSVCSRPSVDNSSHQSAEDSSAEDGEDNSMAIVPVPREEASSITKLIKELPEARPGWPLLRRAMLPDPSERSMIRKISVVQWAMQLPSRRHRQNSCDPGEDQPSSLDGETGAIVPVGSEAMIAPSSPDHNLRKLPRELEGLHEKYSYTCRLFNYQELQSATSYFLAGMLSTQFISQKSNIFFLHVLFTENDSFFNTRKSDWERW